MSTISVDRIVVQATGLSPEEGRRLAAQLAAGLGDAVPAGNGAATIPTVRVHAEGQAGVDELAHHMLTSIASELRRHV